MPADFFFSPPGAAAPSGEPKRPTNAYMTFAGEVRETVKEANPGASMGELSKLLGEKWKGISEERKANYQAKARRDRAEIAPRWC